MDGAQNFILIEARADGLPDLGEQFVLLRAAVRVVRYQIVVERETELQSQSDHETRAGGAEGFAVAHEEIKSLRKHVRGSAG